MTEQVILDVDGTLLNWRDTYVEWLRSFNLYCPETEEIDASEYNLKNYISVPDGKTRIFPVNPEFSNSLSEIFNQTYLLGKLPPMPGAVGVIRRLHSEGYRLKVVSSYTTQYEAMRTREKNLITVFGDVFQEITSLPLHSSKKEYLSKQDKNSYFIEDSIDNIKDAIEVGFDQRKCFLVEAPYNVDRWRKGIVTKEFAFQVGNWKTIGQEILGI